MLLDTYMRAQNTTHIVRKEEMLKVKVMKSYILKDMLCVQAAFKNIEKTEKRADSAYRAALEQYPKNPKLLKSYGRFLEHVRNNPISAGHYYR